MKKIVFTEEFCSPENLFPFTLTRQIQDIRVGILTIREKWELSLNCQSFDQDEKDYKDLDRAIIIDENIGEDTIFLIHGNILPTEALVKKIKKLKPGEFLSVPGRESLAYCITRKEVLAPGRIRVSKAVEWDGVIDEVRYPWDLFRLNKWAIEEDYRLLTEGKKSSRIPSTNQVIQPSSVFIEKGARVEYCLLNASEGPIYIGKNAELMEGCMVRGPVAIGERALLKMGAKVYGASTIGPGCIVGGEIKNSLFFSNSNKAHDGYIGDSVIGEWCNLGAGTSNSNLKNNASPVQVWTPNGVVSVGLKCGMFMGDYSKTAINTSINTGTVIGVCANVFGHGLSPKYIPSFSWGNEGIERYNFEKAKTDIGNWKSLKGQRLTENEEKILKHIFDHY